MRRTSTHLCLFLLHSSKTADGTTDCDTTGCGQCVGSSSNGFAARFAFPDSNTCSLDIVLSAKHASVGRVLRHLHLSDNLSECGTISGSVLSRDSDLLGALTHCD